MNRLTFLFTVIVGVSLLACRPAPAEEHDMADARKLEDTPKLTVRGEAQLQRPADQLRLNIGVLTEDKEAGVALKQNNRLMENVVDALLKVGLTEDEYETGRFRIRPQYSRRPRQPDPDWQPKIIGYEVVNSITIKTKQLDLIGELIGAANRAGANTTDIAGFELSDPRKYRGEAIAEATKNALDDARTLAEAASLNLVRILAINLDSVPNRMPEMTFAARAKPMADMGGAPPITPGDVTVSATVTVVYEIAPKQQP